MKPLSLPLFVQAALPALVLAAAAAPADAPGTAVRFGPERGLRLEKTFENRWEVTMDELKVVIDEQPIPEEFLPPMELVIGHEATVVVTDEYRTLGAGRPAQLARSFDQIAEHASTSFEMQGAPPTDEESEGTSALEGRTVVFTWDEDDGEYRRAYAEGSGDEVLLEELVEDMDLRGFLPADEVAEGETWKVDVQQFEHLLSPGGELHIEGMEREAEESEYLPLEGELEVTFRGERERDGRRLAELEIAAQVEAAMVYVTGLEQVPVTSGKATETFTMRLDVEGRLWWDVEAGHLSALELGGSLDVEIDTVKDVELSPEDPTPYESTMLLSGDWNLAVSTGSE